MADRHRVVHDLLQEQNEKIAGIKLAPRWKKAPGKIGGRHCPIIIAWPGEGTVTVAAADKRIERRYWNLEVFTAPVGTRNHATNVLEASELFSEVSRFWAELHKSSEDHYLDYGEGSGYRIVIDYSQDIEDTGVTGDRFYDDPERRFYGFQIQVPVLVYWGAAFC